MKCLGVPALGKMFQRTDKVMLWVEGVKSPSKLREEVRRSAISHMQRLLNQDYKRKRQMQADFKL